MIGIKFPLTVNTLTGNLQIAEDAELFRGHILSWLQTQPKERVMRIPYGLDDYLFQSTSDTTLIISNIKKGLQEYVPDVDIDVAGEINEIGEILITVFWSYKNEDQTDITLKLW